MHHAAPSTEELIRQALLEDGKDITSEATIPADMVTTAVMRAREAGVIAGVDVAAAVFNLIDPSLEITSNVRNGDLVAAGDLLLTITGNARSIMMAERVALNFASHLSGIATTTRAYVDAVAGLSAKIYDTRKTLPCLRSLQKAAVVAGGGVNHRFGLHDAILIKDNHIAVAGGIKAALEGARDSAANASFIEIEVDTLEQLREALACGIADVIMLDNMQPEQLAKAVGITKGRVKLEASGGVNLSTVRDIADSGVDIISVGALTHSVKALDIGLDIDI